MFHWLICCGEYNWFDEMFCTGSTIFASAAAKMEQLKKTLNNN